MSGKKANLRGVPAILRANAIDLVVFAAVNFQKSVNPDGSVRQTIKSVIQHFGIEGASLEALEVAYYRTQETFVKEGGL